MKISHPKHTEGTNLMDPVTRGNKMVGWGGEGMLACTAQAEGCGGSSSWVCRDAYKSM